MNENIKRRTAKRDEESIYDQILGAIFERKLLPGTLIINQHAERLKLERLMGMPQNSLSAATSAVSP